MINQQRVPSLRTDANDRTFDGLQAGRAFAAIAVLLFHTNAVLGLQKYLGKDVLPILHAGASGVHFFFVLSGFIIFYVHHREIGHSSFVGSFARKRVARLIPALWATLSLVLMSYLFWPSLNTNPSLTFFDIVSAFFLVPSAREPLLVVEWTLRHEALFYALFALAIVSRRIGVSILAIWLSLSLFLPFFPLDFPASFIFSEYHVLFGIGIVVAISFDRRWIRFPRTLLVFGTSAFIVTWIARNAGAEGVIVNLAFGGAAGTIVAGLTEIERISPLGIPRFLAFLGDASYSIYLVHFLAVSAASKFLLLVLRLVALPDIVSFCFVAGAALLAGACFHIWIERPLTSASRVLLKHWWPFGGRPATPAPPAEESL